MNGNEWESEWIEKNMDVDLKGIAFDCFWERKEKNENSDSNEIKGIRQEKAKNIFINQKVKEYSLFIWLLRPYCWE